jgi:hypothetical protein
MGWVDVDGFTRHAIQLEWCVCEREKEREKEEVRYCSF